MADEDVAGANTTLEGATTIDSGGPAAFVPRPSVPNDVGDPDADFVVYPNGERYEARRQLGEGGMGEVRLCRDRVIGREVAMKVVRGTDADRDELRYRFVREARVQGQLEHPAIPSTTDGS